MVTSSLVGGRDEGTHPVGTAGVVLDQLERRHVTVAYGVALLERGQVVEHTADRTGQAAASTSCETSASSAPRKRCTAASFSSGSPSMAGSSATVPAATSA